MNKKTYIILGVVILVIIIIFGVIVWNHKTAQAPVVSTSTTTTTTSTSMTTPTSSASSSSTSSQPVKIVLSTNYTGPSFSLIYPDSWTNVPAGDFSIDTFKGNFGTGGVIPAGGATLDIATTTSYGPVQNIINTELSGGTDITTSTVTVDKISCEKAIFKANYGPGATSQNISIYCSRGTELWKIYLSYNANDPGASTHISDFNSILTSMKFLP